MDKKVFQSGNSQEEGPKRIEKKKRRLWPLIAAAVLAVLAVVMAVLWNPTAFDGLRRSVLYASMEKDENGCVPLYRYASERDSVYAAVGDSLVQASRRRILLMDGEGQVRYNTDLKFREAAICTAGDRAAVYDIGGKEIYVLGEDRLVHQVNAEGEIYSCSLNSRGDLAVTLSKSGSKASVVVYNAKGEKIFGFNSVDRFLMTADLSEDGSTMAAVTMGQSEGAFASSLVVYDLGRTDPVAECILPGGAVYDLAMLDGKWCTVGEDGLYFLPVDGSADAIFYDFEGSYLRRCSLQGRDHAALLLGRYKSGTQTYLVTVDTDGTQLAILPVDREVLSITSAGRYTAVLYSNELVVYDRELNVCASLPEISAAKTALMREDGSVVLAGADAAGLYLP